MPLARGGAGAGAASSSSLAAFGGAFCAMEAQLMMLSEGSTRQRAVRKKHCY